jgi:hypothetical protein
MDNTISDMYYIQLPTGGPTQGDIWSNLPSRSNESELCDGLVITPRCDFAHSKSPVVNYLPIVSLEKYLLSVACFPQIEQIIGETLDGLRGKVAALNIDYLFDLNVPIDEIQNELEQLKAKGKLAKSKQVEKAITEFDAGIEKLKGLKGLLGQPKLTWDQLTSVLVKKRLYNTQRDLIKNNHADTYFLPPCDGLLEVPSLVLLRHIYTCPIGIVEPGRNGRTDRLGPPKTSAAPERLLRLNSPFIESLMAKFAALFTRVGTRDIPDQTVQTFILSESLAEK